MDFASISNINSYIKTTGMKNIWKQKAGNPAAVIPGSPFKISENTSQQSGSFGDGRLNSIMAKMQSGQGLSVEDMEYLRDNYPAIYDEAIKMEKEKDEYKKALRRCKTKDDARMLQMGKVSEAMMTLKSGAVDGRAVLAKLAKMTEVYVKFVGTKHYEKLAENYLELAEIEKAEKEAEAPEKENSEIKVQKEDENNEVKVQNKDENTEIKPQTKDENAAVNPDYSDNPQSVYFDYTDKPKEVHSNKSFDFELFDFKPSDEPVHKKIDRRA